MPTQGESKPDSGAGQAAKHVAGAHLLLKAVQYKIGEHPKIVCNRGLNRGEGEGLRVQLDTALSDSTKKLIRVCTSLFHSLWVVAAFQGNLLKQYFDSVLWF